MACSDFTLRLIVDLAARILDLLRLLRSRAIANLRALQRVISCRVDRGTLGVCRVRCIRSGRCLVSITIVWVDNLFGLPDLSDRLLILVGESLGGLIAQGLN